MIIKRSEKDVVALLDKHAGKLDASDMLALASHVVGQLLAMQDQRRLTPDMAIELVQQNIEQGNKEVIEKLITGSEGSA